MCRAAKLEKASKDFGGLAQRSEQQATAFEHKVPSHLPYCDTTTLIVKMMLCPYVQLCERFQIGQSLAQGGHCIKCFEHQNCCRVTCHDTYKYQWSELLRDRCSLALYLDMAISTFFLTAASHRLQSVSPSVLQAIK